MEIDKELFKTAVETPTSMSIDTREIEKKASVAEENVPLVHR